LLAFPSLQFAVGRFVCVFLRLPGDQLTARWILTSLTPTSRAVFTIAAQVSSGKGTPFFRNEVGQSLNLDCNHNQSLAAYALTLAWPPR
jgi:hypothetical protein